MGMYQGVNASEGIGIGTVMVAVDPDLTFEPHEVADSAAEKERYQSALSVFCEKTQAQADHMKETVGEAEAEIMSGHIVLAQDPGMTDAINAAIDGGTCAEQALMDTSTMFENMFLSMDDEMFRLRAADIADIRTGILAELLGKEVVDLSVLPENTVVVVHDLTPSMTATIDKAHVAGIVTETGGRTSHSAIIARALEIPAVLSVSNSCTALRNGMTVVVDGGKGIVEADPDEETLAAYTAKAEAFAAEKAALEAFRGKPSVTADGIKKIIACNIGNPDDVPRPSVCSAPSSCSWTLLSFLPRRSSSTPTVRSPARSRVLRSSSARSMLAATRRFRICTWSRKITPSWASAPCVTAWPIPTSTRSSSALCCALAPSVTSRS